MTCIDQPDSLALAAALVTRLALAVPDPRLRARTAERVARAVLGEDQPSHPDQLRLPIG